MIGTHEDDPIEAVPPSDLVDALRPVDVDRQGVSLRRVGGEVACEEDDHVVAIESFDNGGLTLNAIQVSFECGECLSGDIARCADDCRLES